MASKIYSDSQILTSHTFAFLYLRVTFNYIKSSFNLDTFLVAGNNFYTFAHVHSVLLKELFSVLIT